LETTISPVHGSFFLKILLNYILKNHVSYDKAFKTVITRYEFPRWTYGSLYKLGYYVINYYYAIRWLSAGNGFGVKTSGLVDYIASRGFSIRRILDELVDEVKALSTVKRFSLYYSYPEFLVNDLLKHMNRDELERTLHSLNTRKRWLRINYLKTNIEEAIDCLVEEGFDFVKKDHPEYMVFVKKPLWKPLGGNKCVSRGMVIPQDISSAIVVETIGITNELIDACSAPGLKLSLASMLNNRLLSIGIDKSINRLLVESTLLNRLGVRSYSYILIHSDSIDIAFRKRSSTVLIDAPCSGLGSVYSDPAVKINTSTRSKIMYYHNIQYNILRNMLRYGERVVYTTCSIHPLEGEAVVEKVVEEGLAQPIKINNPYLTPSYRGYKVSKNTYRINPYNVKGQGFYIALLESMVKND